MDNHSPDEHLRAASGERARVLRAVRLLTIVFLVSGIMLFAYGMANAETAAFDAEISTLSGRGLEDEPSQLPQLAGGALFVLGRDRCRRPTGRARPAASNRY